MHPANPPKPPGPTVFIRIARPACRWRGSRTCWRPERAPEGRTGPAFGRSVRSRMRLRVQLPAGLPSWRSRSLLRPPLKMGPRLAADNEATHRRRLAAGLAAASTSGRITARATAPSAGAAGRRTGPFPARCARGQSARRARGSSLPRPPADASWRSSAPGARLTGTSSPSVPPRRFAVELKPGLAPRRPVLRRRQRAVFTLGPSPDYTCIACAPAGTASAVGNRGAGLLPYHLTVPGEPPPPAPRAGPVFA